MRGKILQQLKEMPEVSGEYISRCLGISRAAVGKHIQALRKEGYEIKAAPQRGYSLINTPNKPLPREILSFFPSEEDKELFKNIYYLPEVDSTNIYLRRLAEEGAPEFTAVFAEEQTAGRGRLARAWHSPKGVSLFFSLLFRPPLSPMLAQTITLTSAVAVSEGLEELGFDCRIKWPNDIFLNGKKICGILSEMRSDPDTVKWQVVGIGLNINNSAFPPYLEELATSLKIEGQNEISRPKAAAVLLRALREEYQILCRQGFEPIRQKWLKKAWLMNQRAYVSLADGKKIPGITRGMSPEGYLLLENDNGAITPIPSGDLLF